MTSLTSTAPPTRRERERAEFRTDVEGMRAVAVLAVVLYHAGVVHGGFVGVDVFFVLSGFLITGLLWRELEPAGHINFPSFYGRRARRLLPASALVLVVSAYASTRWLTPLAARTVLGDAKAAALYVANFRFIAQKTDYLAPHVASPFQHYWSLAVEEQFYLCWPLLLLAVTRLRRGRVVAIWWTLAALAGLSFLLSLVWTRSSQAWAFFSLPARAWQLLAGALVAFGAVRLRRLRQSVAGALTWIGLAAVLWSVVAYSSSTSYPGTAALVPVLGTVALLIGGCAAPARGVRVLLDHPWMQIFGRISYAWYLWHWPVLILAPAAVGHSLNTVENVVLAACSGVLAYGTTVFVERPIRFSRALARHAARSLALGAGLTAASLTVIALAAGSLPSLEGHGEAPVLHPQLALSRPSTASHHSANAAIERTTSPTTLDPVSAALRSAVHEENVPANLSPSLGRAESDKAAPFLDGCNASFVASTVGHCVYGDPHGTKTIVLIGDSHASMYQPAFDLVGKAKHWRLVMIAKATCPPFIEHLFSPVLGRDYSECTQFHANALARIAAEHPAAVVVSVARHYGPPYHFAVYSSEWIDGIGRVVRQLRPLTPHVLVFSPTPRPPADVPSCLSANLHTAGNCAIQPNRAVPADGFAAEQHATDAAGGRYVDVTPWYCTNVLCPPIVGNLLVYRDDNHISTTYSAWLANRVAALLGPLVA